LSRNSSSRLGLDSKKQNPVDDAASIPEFSFISPTELVELPSRGELYPDSHPLHNKESLEIRFMTAKEEDILLNESYIKSGVVIDKLIHSLLVDKSIQVNSLLVGDKSALIVAARISGYGHDYNTKIECPKCSSKVEYSFDLNTAKVYHGDDYDEKEVQKTESGTFILNTPLSKVKVEIRPMNGADERHMADMLRSKKKSKIASKLITQQLKRTIVTVNDYDHPHYIDTFIDAVPARDSSYIRKILKKVTPNIELKDDFVCEQCSHEEFLEVPFNADFFWPDR
jgi:hypothetical protein